MTVPGIRQSAKELLEIDHYNSQRLETEYQRHTADGGQIDEDFIRKQLDRLNSVEDINQGATEKGRRKTLDLDEGPIDEEAVRRHFDALAPVELDLNQSEHEEQDVSEHTSGAKWLRINLILCTITVWLMFVVAGIELAFATLVQDDLKDDETGDSYYRYQCTQNYVYGWDLGENWKSLLDQRCGFLLSWTYVMQVAGSFSLVRTLMQGLPIYRQTYWTIHFREGGWFDRFVTPAKAFAIRTIFSAGAFAFHIASAVMLGCSALINDKEPAAYEYQIMYRICLGLVCLCTLATGQQTFTTGFAAWRLRSSRRVRIWQL